MSTHGIERARPLSPCPQCVHVQVSGVALLYATCAAFRSSPARSSRWANSGKTVRSTPSFATRGVSCSPTQAKIATSYIPFDKSTDGLYRWEVAAVGRSFSKLRSVPVAESGASMVAPAAIRGANAHSHVGILSAEDAGVVMHNRLHVGGSLLRRLPDCTLDAPDVLKRCPKISCDACTEANAARLARSHASGHTPTKSCATTRPGQCSRSEKYGRPLTDHARSSLSSASSRLRRRPVHHLQPRR